VWRRYGPGDKRNPRIHKQPVSTPPARQVSDTRTRRTDGAELDTIRSHGLPIASSVCQRLTVCVCTACVLRSLLRDPPSLRCVR